jgi:Glycosyl hydrolase family 63 N-terminal domain
MDPETGLQGFIPLLGKIIGFVPPPKVSRDEPFSMVVSLLSSDTNRCRVATGRVCSVAARIGNTVQVVNRNGGQRRDAKISCIKVARGVSNTELQIAAVGDIVSVSGVNYMCVSDKIGFPPTTASAADCSNILMRIITPVLALAIDSHTVSINFRVNDLPLAGMDGHILTTPRLTDRLQREAESNVSIAVGSSSPPLWSTYRPHAFASARARIPHSPSYSIMYHDATSFDAVRHLAADDHGGSIQSFSFMKHGAQSFAEHKAENVGLNAFISSSFLNRRADGGRADGEEERRIFRVTYSALDPSRDTGKVSVAFDASASPSELDDEATYIIERGDEAPWGIIKLTDKQYLQVSGISGDCVIYRNASSVGGPYHVIVREPTIGGLSSHERILFSSVGRRRRRSRAEASLADSDFCVSHVAAHLIDTKRSFLANEMLKVKLRQSEQHHHHMKLSANADEQHRVGMHILANEIEEGAQIMLVQPIVELSFDMEIVFAMCKSRSNAQVTAIVDELSGKQLDTLLVRRRVGFEAKFEKAFGPRKAGYSAKDADFARLALGNTLHGIGYFTVVQLWQRRALKLCYLSQPYF